MDGRFTGEELNIAKQVDLVKVASAVGFTPVKIGRYYTLMEMDSIRIYDRSHWYRWSRGEGGSQIDFLKAFAGFGVKKAVFWLLDFAGYSREAPPYLPPGNNGNAVRNVIGKRENAVLEKEFILPEKNGNNRRMYQYLSNRGLSGKVIGYFASQGLLYETKQYHNICFLGNDADGVPRSASLRGTFDTEGKKGFKMDVAGSDKNYGFHLFHEQSRQVVVTESAIDAMSYVEITGDYSSNLIALGMLADRPLEKFLEEHKSISITTFALDNDEPGKAAAEKLDRKYRSLGYETRRLFIPEEYKDLNEWASQKGMEQRRIAR